MASRLGFDGVQTSHLSDPGEGRRATSSSDDGSGLKRPSMPRCASSRSTLTCMPALWESLAENEKS
jgi:hypothetical protein